MAGGRCESGSHPAGPGGADPKPGLPANTAMSGEWDNVNSADQLFVWLTPQTDAKRVEKQINDIAAVHSVAVRPKNGVRERWHPLQPLNEAILAPTSLMAAVGRTRAFCTG